MDNQPQRSMPQTCVSWFQPGTQAIVVHQVIGEKNTQEVVNVCVRVPRRKPAIEQIINVYINKVCITNLEVLTDAVIVWGHFDVKVLYVACLEDQPVHAVEKRRVRFSTEVCIPGVRCGMDADASVALEFVDYSCNCERHAPEERYPHHHKPAGCTRICDVSVVLSIMIRVMADRELFMVSGKAKG